MKLREVIENATPGPWKVTGAYYDFADITAVDSGEQVALTASNSETNDDARFIAAYSPDHALLIEDVLAEFKELLSVLDSSEYEGWDGAMDALDSYRKAHGYEG